MRQSFTPNRGIYAPFLSTNDLSGVLAQADSYMHDAVLTESIDYARLEYAEDIYTPTPMEGASAEKRPQMLSGPVHGPTPGRRRSGRIPAPRQQRRNLCRRRSQRKRRSRWKTRQVSKRWRGGFWPMKCPFLRRRDGRPFDQPGLQLLCKESVLHGRSSRQKQPGKKNAVLLPPDRRFPPTGPRPICRKCRKIIIDY